ncbi:MAG: recombinase family protein [Thermoleophilia bacterium]
MNCLIYLRVSTKEQAQTNETEGYSIAAQRKACAKYVQEKGWTLIDEYTDRGESARSAHRPMLQEMLKRVKEDKSINAVVVHKIDRLARNLKDHVEITATLQKANCALVSVVENIEDTASGKLVEGIHAIVAEFYSSNLSAEVKKGMLEKVKQGGWPHQAPMGYKNLRDGTRNIATVVIDPETASHIEEAFKLYATGDFSLDHIRDFLFDRGMKNIKNSKKPLAMATVANLLTNPFYTGVVRYKGIEYPGQHEALITRQLFQKVQAIYEVRNQGSSVRTRKNPHYLKGTLFCAECGSRLSIDTAKGKYTYFFCLGTKRGRGCTHTKHTPAAEIEEEVEKLYEDVQMSKDAADKLTKRFDEELISKQSTNAMEKQFLAKRIGKLADEQIKLLKAYYAEAVPLHLLKKEQDRIANEAAVSQNRLEIIDMQLDELKETLELALDIATQCGFGYKAASQNTRRFYNKAFFEKIYIKDGKVVDKEFTDLFCDLLTEGSDKRSLVGPAGLEPATGRL